MARNSNSYLPPTNRSGISRGMLPKLSKDNINKNYAASGATYSG